MLTPTGWEILKALCEKEEQGEKEVSAREVARLLHDEIEVAEREVGALVDAGLLRKGDLATPRMLFAALTDKGRETVRRSVEREGQE